jgi:hypothetical protein
MALSGLATTQLRWSRRLGQVHGQPEVPQLVKPDIDANVVWEPGV